jgi:hypothetical protein
MVCESRRPPCRLASMACESSFKSPPAGFLRASGFLQTPSRSALPIAQNSPPAPRARRLRELDGQRAQRAPSCTIDLACQRHDCVAPAAKPGKGIELSQQPFVRSEHALGLPHDHGQYEIVRRGSGTDRAPRLSLVWVGQVEARSHFGRVPATPVLADTDKQISAVTARDRSPRRPATPSCRNCGTAARRVGPLQVRTAKRDTPPGSGASPA